MPKKKLIVNFGQSNSGPFHDLATWLPERRDLNLLVSPLRVSGSYSPLFSMPGGFPGYGTRSLKGLAIDTIRYLTFYNPVASGYTSYPGHGRVIAPSVGFTHTTQTVWVEQQFDRGASQVASITRKTGSVTTPIPVAAILTPSMPTAPGDWDDSTEEITLVAHGFIDNDPLTIEFSGTPPTGVAAATTYYASVIDDDTIQLLNAPGGAVVPFTGVGTGTHTLKPAMPTRAGSRLKFAPADAWLPPAPQPFEEFTYPITATASTTTTVTLNLGFGVLRNTTASLLGIQLTIDGETRTISGWDNTTRQATVSTAFTGAPTPGPVTLAPPGGVPWHKWCYFLPWCMFETDLTALLGKVNPYPPGFDYPTHFHVPQLYSTDEQTPTVVENTGFFRLTVPHWLSWHCSGLVRIAEFLGEEVYCVSCDFGGTSTAHNEREIGQGYIGWYDQAQQNDWTLAKDNNCLARFWDEIDAAIAAAAAQGDTLELVAVFRVQADADASLGSDPTYGAIDGLPTDAWARKFFDTNRAFRQHVREGLKARGLWAGDAETIPWIQPLLQEEFVNLLVGDIDRVTAVRTSLQALADSDIYAETWDPTGLLTWDGNHYLGSELDLVEDEMFRAWQRIVQRTSREGEVDICNLALSRLGEKARVTSIDPPDASFAAKLCARHYAEARNSILEMHTWGFGMQRRPLTLLQALNPRGTKASKFNESLSYEYTYVRPADALKVVSVIPATASDDYVDHGQVISYNPYERLSNEAHAVPHDFTEERTQQGIAVLRTDLEDAHVRFLGLVTNTRLYSAQLRDAIAYKLASMIAGSIVKGERGAQQALRMEQAATAIVARAKDNDSNQRQVRPRHRAPWLKGSR